MTELYDLLGVSRSHILRLRSSHKVPRKYLNQLEGVPFEQQRAAPVTRQYSFRWLNAVGPE